MTNQEIASIFYEIARMLELKDENQFRIRSYEKAARNIETLTEPISEIVQQGQLNKIPGIGQSIGAKIEELLSTGKLKQYEELKSSVPQGLLEIANLPGLGQKRARILYQKLNIKNVKGLERACKQGKVQELPGFGMKIEENILAAIAMQKSIGKRLLLFQGLDIANRIVRELGKMKQIKKLEPAGSLRRRKETIGDIDILCTVDDPSKSSKLVMERFVKLPMVKTVIAKGETKSSVRVEDDVQVDLRVVDDNSFGAAMMYFTGSKDHNIAIRTRALKMGCTINEYGLFEVGNNKPVAGKTERELFEKLKLQYIPPELRECRGELESAEKEQLPVLVEQSDIKGDSHVHSTYSDGAGTIDEIADGAEKRGYEWIAVTDHSQSLKIANGLEPKRVIQKIEEIRKYNEQNKNVRVLCGTEVDIMSDGSLDYDDELLSRLDIVVAAIHSGFKQPKEILTKRIVRAMENKYVHIIAHPTGRHFGKREPYELDMTEIFRVALETGTALEINAHPVRLDLPDFYCQKAAEKGVQIAIGTDAHALWELEYMELGVSVARRGWLSKNNIWNSRSYSQLAKILGRKRGD